MGAIITTANGGLLAISDMTTAILTEKTYEQLVIAERRRFSFNPHRLTETAIAHNVCLKEPHGPPIHHPNVVTLPLCKS